MTFLKYTIFCALVLPQMSMALAQNNDSTELPDKFTIQCKYTKDSIVKWKYNKSKDKDGLLYLTGEDAISDYNFENHKIIEMTRDGEALYIFYRDRKDWGIEGGNFNTYKLFYDTETDSAWLDYVRINSEGKIAYIVAENSDHISECISTRIF